MGILDSSRSACLLSVHNSGVISFFPRLIMPQLVVGELLPGRGSERALGRTARKATAAKVLEQLFLLTFCQSISKPHCDDVCGEGGGDGSNAVKKEWINAALRARVDRKAQILSDKPSSNWGRCHQVGTKNYTECCHKVEVGISTATSWEETTTP